jgi:hypothetical protein
MTTALLLDRSRSRLKFGIEIAANVEHAEDPEFDVRWFIDHNMLSHPVAAVALTELRAGTP